MKITLEMPDNIMALTNVFYTKEEDGMTKIWTWTVAPKDGVEFCVVRNQDGSFGVAENTDMKGMEE